MWIKGTVRAPEDTEKERWCGFAVDLVSGGGLERHCWAGRWIWGWSGWSVDSMFESLSYFAGVIGPDEGSEVRLLQW